MRLKLEQELKKRAEGLYTTSLSGGIGSAAWSQGINQCPGRTPLSDRVEQRIQQADSEVRRAGELRELLELLHKHPDVARILDLLGSLPEVL